MRRKCRPSCSARYSSSRRLDLIAAKEWPADKPLPDVEQLVPRALLEKTLKDMNYVPAKLKQ